MFWNATTTGTSSALHLLSSVQNQFLCACLLHVNICLSFQNTVRHGQLLSRFRRTWKDITTNSSTVHAVCLDPNTEICQRIRHEKIPHTSTYCWCRSIYFFISNLSINTSGINMLLGKPELIKCRLSEEPVRRMVDTA